MHLIIDIGNSRSKLVAFDGGQPVDERFEEGASLNGIEDFACQYDFDDAIISSVRDLDESLLLQLRQQPFPFLHFTPQTPVPIVNCYRTPSTLGTDRLAAAVGAWSQHKGSNLLIIDAGSCITFDVVSARGEFLGGNISPGMHARLHAIDDYFPRLPLGGSQGDVPELGYDTETAIRAGVIEGMKHEIEGYIRHFRVKYPDLLVFLTGGDEFHFDETIKSSIFADPFIVPRGLEVILNYNRRQQTEQK